MAEPASPPGAKPYAAMLVGFADRLRDCGLSVGTGDVVTYTESVATLDPTDLLDLYWAGRCALVTRQEQIPVYHREFVRYFLEGSAAEDPVSQPFTPQQRAETRSVLDVPETESGSERREEREARLGLMASEVATMRAKSFSACTDDELAALRRMMRTWRLTPPRRRTRRSRPAARGSRPDLRRTVRETMRLHGEPASLHLRRRQLRLRPVTLLLDVSGSMADHSRNLVQFAHTSARMTTRMEVFCFGTRLTRITRQLEHRSPDEALARAAVAVTDWDGGTRIGDCLDRFVRDWARRGRCRGGVVVICSDGLDRGDPAVLEKAMERLSRLCHRIVWVHPSAGAPPRTLGMAAAAPFVDAFVSGHDLTSLRRLVELLPELR